MESDKKKRKLQGLVVSNKMNKTIVVRVDSLKRHPKYQKQYTVSRRYQAHDPYGNFNVGDKVTIMEARPISKNKKWLVMPKKSQ